MSLKASEQIVLDAIEHNLRTADPELSIAFESFTSVTAHLGLPESEQLGGSQKPAVKPAGQRVQPAGQRVQPAGQRVQPAGQVAERTKITFAMWLAILFLVGMVLAGTVLALFSPARQSSCPGAVGPAFGQARAAGGLVHGRNVPTCSGTSSGR
jgi:hypothetical protein